MSCADYGFYSSSFGGRVIPLGEFEELEKRACEYLSAVTFGRFSSLPLDDRTKSAVCAVAEAIFTNKSGGGIAEEKVGDVRVRYVRGISNTESPSRRLYNTAMRYLADTGTMFRGSRNV